MINYTASYTDQYELAMAQVYFLTKRENDRAVFDYFFRSLPFNSGYAVYAGLNHLLDVLENLHFSEEDLKFLKEQNHHESFIEYLRSFRFKGTIYSCHEGEIIFPNQPVLRVEGPLIEAQIIETLLLNILNYQTLIATKAARIREVAKDKILFEFGLRRAQGPGGYLASRASIIGGFDGTSNVKAALDFGVSPSGTMAHSFIQSSSDELTAFRHFAELRPEDCVLLIDTYSTLESGLPHAIQVANEMEQKGLRLKGIRLDSGDLAYLSRECRKRLDENHLSYVKIVASNQLDEHVIESLNEQGAPIDVFGVGTKLVIGYPDGALDGVYKLSELNGEARIKLSDTVSKISLPHRKQIFRVMNEDGTFYGADVIGLAEEKNIKEMFHPVEHLSFLDIGPYTKIPLLKKVMSNGRRTEPAPSLKDLQAFARNRLKLLPPEFKRFDNPHLYKVGLSGKLKTIRDNLVLSHKGRIL